jgi:hypothetical protein
MPFDASVIDAECSVGEKRQRDDDEENCSRARLSGAQGDKRQEKQRHPGVVSVPLLQAKLARRIAADVLEKQGDHDRASREQ